MRVSVDNRQIFHRADCNTMPATAACLAMNPRLALILGGLGREPEPLPQQSQNPARKTQALLRRIALPQLVNGERNFFLRPPDYLPLLVRRFFQHPLVANTIRHEQMQSANHLCAQLFQQPCSAAGTISTQHRHRGDNKDFLSPKSCFVAEKKITDNFRHVTEINRITEDNKIMLCQQRNHVRAFNGNRNTSAITPSNKMLNAMPRVTRAGKVNP